MRRSGIAKFRGFPNGQPKLKTVQTAVWINHRRVAPVSRLAKIAIWRPGQSRARSPGGPSGTSRVDADPSDGRSWLLHRVQLSQILGGDREVNRGVFLDELGVRGLGQGH